MTFPINQPADNAAPYTWTQPIRDTIGAANEHQVRLGVVHNVGNSGSALTLNPNATGPIKVITLTANCTFTFTITSAITGVAYTLELVLKQDATGSRLVTWPTSVDWAGSAPTLSISPNSVDRLVFTTYDGGTNWYGDLIGKSYA